MRLVDADALLTEYDRVHEGPPGAARALIENAPTIEIPADVHNSCADTIYRQAAINKMKERLIETALNNVGIMQNVDEVLVDVAEERLENWFDEVPSAQPQTKCIAKITLNEKQVRDAVEKAKHEILTVLPRWIPVTEQLPTPRVDVWCNSDLGQMVGYYEEHVGLWYGRDYLELNVNAWMPLPEPYKEGQDGH